MSITKEITLWCDFVEPTTSAKCKKKSIFTDETTGGGQLTYARKAAAKRGWVHVDGRDLCPRHPKPKQ